MDRNSLRLRIEDNASCPFCNGHAQVHIQPDTCDLHAGIALVGAGQVGVVVMMVVTTAVRVAAVTARLGRHSRRRQTDAMRDVSPIVRRAKMRTCGSTSRQCGSAGVRNMPMARWGSQSSGRKQGALAFDM